MQRYILVRLLQTIVVIFLVSLVVFSLSRLSGDPVLLMLGPDARLQDFEVLRHELRLDRPIYVQYLDFIRGAVKGQFGESIRFKIPCIELIKKRFPITLQLAALAMVFAVSIGVTVGILSAIRPGGGMDQIGRIVAMMGVSMPVFWVGIMLILIFSVKLRVFPTSGIGGMAHWIMPAVALGWSSMAAQTRLARSAMLDVLDSEYIKMARIKGVPETLVILKHALRNAAIPIVTMSALQFMLMMNGAVLTETIFALPGLGREVVDAVFSRDYPVIQAILFFTSSAFVLVNFLVDILYAYLDPRIRYQ